MTCSYGLCSGIAVLQLVLLSGGPCNLSDLVPIFLVRMCMTQILNSMPLRQVQIYPGKVDDLLGLGTGSGKLLAVVLAVVIYWQLYWQK